MTITGKQIREDLEIMQSLVEMAIADKDELGFSYHAYISGKEGVSHGARVKFAELSSDLKSHVRSFSVSISASPGIVAGKPKNATIEKQAIEWVRLNYEILLEYWNDPTALGGTKKFLGQLVPIGSSN